MAHTNRPAVALLIVGLAFAGGSAVGNPAYGDLPVTAGSEERVDGFVFHDVNANGVRDDGEPGLVRTLAFGPGSEGAATHDTTSGSDGSYSFDNLSEFEPLPPVGGHVFINEIDGVHVECPDETQRTLDPTKGGCYELVQPWKLTTAQVVPIPLDGFPATVDFGAVPADAQDLGATAIVGETYAPPGTVVAVDRPGCGDTILADWQGTYHSSFTLRVHGAGERSGCYEDGDIVRFRIGSADASNTHVYAAGVPVKVDMVSMPDHAWFWTDLPLGYGAPDVQVLALVNGRVCGETTLEANPHPDVAGAIWGFHRLTVPRTTLASNCGSEGATVSFYFDGVRSPVTATWAAGVQEVPLTVPPPGTPATLPATGGPP